MSLSPIGVGDQSVSHHTFTVDGGAAWPLTDRQASDITMHIVNTKDGTLAISTGAWTITDAANGKADWTPTAADVGTAGVFRWYPVIQLSSGPKAFDPQLVEVKNWL